MGSWSSAARGNHTTWEASRRRAKEKPELHDRSCKSRVRHPANRTPGRELGLLVAIPKLQRDVIIISVGCPDDGGPARCHVAPPKDPHSLPLLQLITADIHHDAKASSECGVGLGRAALFRQCEEVRPGL